MQQSYFNSRTSNWLCQLQGRTLEKPTSTVTMSKMQQIWTQHKRLPRKSIYLSTLFSKPPVRKLPKPEHTKENKMLKLSRYTSGIYQNQETNAKIGQNQTNIQQRSNQNPEKNTYAAQATKPSTHQNRPQKSNQTPNQHSTHTNEQANTTENNYKTIITRIIANLSTLITLESIDTSSLDQINKAIENLLFRIQNE
ncbi:hypothetical protein BpHYR1_047253 [Brachionus plicatilis]|uniref:Uncharacterized protein n=1 Tax=Brachionus plicatilis TaxID=10195 RepID=A0A3M7P3K8_BRAPC|nr:hypothetical protein BpHYR1_047253 [Brachionus plicatilis]